MRQARAHGSRIPGSLGAFAGVLAVGGAGGALAAELRHRRALEADPQWELLRSPLRGEPASIRSADGTLLHAEIFGETGAPTVVLIPGWTEELQIFDLLTRGLLGRGFRVVAYDPRGQGSSDAPRGLDQSIERYAEDLAAVLDATCAGRDDTIVAGHSMGGMSLVAWAGAPDRGSAGAKARAVALISTAVSGLGDDLALLPAAIPARARREILGPLLLSDLPMIEISTPLSRAISRRVMFGPDATPAQLAFIESMTWRMNGRLRAAASVTMRELDLSAALARVDVPALVMVGDGDRLTPPIHARRMVAALPHVAEYVLLPRTGHMTPLERPHELCEALVRLADAVGVAPDG